MKKRLLTFIMIATLICLMFALVACNGDVRCADGHTWKVVSLESPFGCLNNGQSYERCSVCGIRRYVDIDPLGHDMKIVEGSSYLPTCTETGYEGTFECLRENCDHIVNGAIIPALGHKDENEDGICEVCGNASCNHIWGEWSNNNDGTHTRVCEINPTHTETAEHNMNDGVITIEPNCDQDGEILYTCVDCGFEETNSVSALGHSYPDEWTSISDDEHIKVCANGCGIDVVDTHDHIEQSRTPATCESAEIIVSICQCGNVKTVEGQPALGHEYEWHNRGNGNCEGVCKNDSTHTTGEQVHIDTVRDNLCDNCGAMLDCQHEFDNEVVTVPATCDKKGVTTYTCIHCGGTYTESINAIGHEYEQEHTMHPDCTNDGLDTFTCSNCQESYTVVVPATGHQFVADTPVAPTCTENGYTTYSCGCGYSYKSDFVQATGHNYTTEETKATCTGEGYTTHTCDCGHSYIDGNVPKEGHNYVDAVTAPTCTTGGYTTYTCSGCGVFYVDDEVPATGHSFDEKVTAPTCTKAGYTTYTCKVENCGYSYKDAFVNATGHTYQRTTVAPTCVEKGYTLYHCSVCGDEHKTNYTELAQHIAGEPVKTNEVFATCTTSGSYTLVTSCKVCGTTLDEKDVSVAPLGHSWSQCNDNGDDTHTFVCEHDASHTKVEMHIDADFDCKCDDCGVEMHYTHDGNINDCENPDCNATLGQHLTVSNRPVNGDKVSLKFGENEYLDVTSLSTEPSLPKTFILDSNAEFFDLDKYALVVEVMDPTVGYYLKAQNGMYVQFDGQNLMLVSEPSGVWYIRDNEGEELIFFPLQSNESLPVAVEGYHNVNIGHSIEYAQNLDGTHKVDCSACGTLSSDVECYDWNIDGVCDGCGAHYDCDHVYQSEVTAPTCTEAGFTTHTCTICGDSYVDEPVEMLGHTVNPANYNKCVVCEGRTYSYHTTDLNDYIGKWAFIDYNDANKSGRKLDGAEESLGNVFYFKDGNSIKRMRDHKLVVQAGIYADTFAFMLPNGKYLALDDAGNIVAITEINENSSWIFADQSLQNCGTQLYLKGPETYNGSFSSTPSLDIEGGTTKMQLNLYDIKITVLPCEHDNEVKNEVEGNCLVVGHVDKECKICGELSTEFTTLGGHDYVEDGRIPATCESDEIIHFTCSICGGTKEEAGATALGHDYSKKEVVSEATCLTAGTATMVCVNCGKSDGVVFDDEDAPALGHKEGDWIDTTDGKHHIKVCQRTNCAVVLEIQEHELQRYWMDPDTHRTYYADYCLDCGYLVQGDEIEEVIDNNFAHLYVPFPVATEYELRAIIESESAGEFGAKLEKDLTLDKPLVPADIRTIMLSEGVTLKGTGQTDDGKYTLIDTDNELFLFACGGTFSVEAPEGEEAYIAISSVNLTTYDLDGVPFGTYTTTGDALFYNDRSGSVCIHSGDKFITDPELVTDEDGDVADEDISTWAGTFKNWDPTNYVVKGIIDTNLQVINEAKHYFVTTATDEDGNIWYTVEHHMGFDLVTTSPTCTAEGYSTYICQTCGEEFVEHKTPAVPHSWGPWESLGTELVGGSIRHCAYDLNHEHSETRRFLPGFSMITSTGPKMRFFATKDALAEYTDLNMRFIKPVYDDYGDFAGEVTTVVTEYTIRGDYLLFDYTGISLKEMGVVFKGEIYSGDEFLSSIEYSAARYIYNNLAKEGNSPEFNRMLVDMLNMGAKAQLYEGYLVDHLVNANLTDEQRAFGTQTTPEISADYMEITPGEEDSVHITYTGLDLDSRVGTVFHFSVGKYNIEDISIILEFGDEDDKILRRVSCKDAVVAEAGVYALICYDIALDEYRQKFTMRFVDKDDQIIGDVMSFNVEAIIAKEYENTTDESLKELYLAIMAFSDSHDLYDKSK